MPITINDIERLFVSLYKAYIFVSPRKDNIFRDISKVVEVGIKSVKRTSGFSDG